MVSTTVRRYAINKRAENGSVLVRFMTSEMSEIIFMQDGAPAHTAKLTQEWCEQNLPAFWSHSCSLRHQIDTFRTFFYLFDMTMNISTNM